MMNTGKEQCSDLGLSYSENTVAFLILHSHTQPSCVLLGWHSYSHTFMCTTPVIEVFNKGANEELQGLQYEQGT